MRLRNNPDAMPFLQEHADLVFINPRDHLGKWHEVFGNNNPIAIEIGMGKVISLSKMREEIQISTLLVLKNILQF